MTRKNKKKRKQNARNSQTSETVGFTVSDIIRNRCAVLAEKSLFSHPMRDIYEC